MIRSPALCPSVRETSIYLPHKASTSLRSCSEGGQGGSLTNHDVRQTRGSSTLESIQNFSAWTRNGVQQILEKAIFLQESLQIRAESKCLVWAEFKNEPRLHHARISKCDFRRVASGNGSPVLEVCLEPFETTVTLSSACTTPPCSRDVGCHFVSQLVDLQFHGYVSDLGWWQPHWGPTSIMDHLTHKNKTFSGHTSNRIFWGGDFCCRR